MDEQPSARREEVTVLLLDADRSKRERIAQFADRNYETLQVLAVTDGQAAIDRLRTTPVDCLVVDPDALDGDLDAFLDARDEAAPDCPIVWLPDRRPTELDEALREPGTTIVETGDDLTDCSFLFEKIQSSIQQRTIGDPDGDLFRRLVESASDGLYALDATGRVVYLNEAFADMLGYSQAALFGVHASTVMAEGELERGQRLIQELLATDDRESDLMDMDMLRKDGTPITVAVHFRVLTTDDGTYNGVMGVVREVTDRKRRERELQRQRDRLEEFASVVSHDLRTPLSVANGRLELAQAEYDSEDIDAAVEALDRMDRLITDLLSLAQQGEVVEIREPVDLEPVATEAWQDVAARSPAELHSDLGGESVMADPKRLRQLFENLFQNAIDHAGPAVTVTVGQLDGGRGFYVEDDGPGIPSEIRDQVFERAYSTRADGTGFGLAIVEQIVQAHDWRIAVTEADTGGARFEITVRT